MVGLATLATGTKVLGGLSKIFGKKKKQDPGATAFRAGIGSIDAAIARGLHPSMGVGGAGGYSGPVSTATASEGLTQVGDAMQRHADRKGNQKLDKKQSELMDAQIAESRSRTLLNAANSRRAIYGPSNNPTGTTGGIETVRRGGPGLDPGETGNRGHIVEPSRDAPGSQKVSIGNETMRGPNPDAFEVGLSELLAGAAIYGPQWLYKKGSKIADAHNKNMKSNSPPPYGGKKLGQIVRRGNMEYQWTRGGWKGRNRRN